MEIRRSTRRKAEIKKNNNFLPALIIAVILWLSLASLIYFTDPANFGVIPIFLIILFFACLFTFSLIFANVRRGIITSAAITIFATLRYFGVGNILNFLLILGISISLESYIWYTKRQ